MSFVCEIVSYAFDRSIYMVRVGLRECICFRILSVTVCSASVVLESDLKAYCVFEMMSCSYRCHQLVVYDGVKCFCYYEE